jgi:hypothetical protein
MQEQVNERHGQWYDEEGKISSHFLGLECILDKY